VSERIQRERSTHAKPEEERVDAKPQDEKLAKETNDILDEIDNVLEENAEQFVRSYVQKGGQ
jgi:ubiquitin-like protein Pup